MDKTREEHLAWCKERALKYVDEGELISAVSSMMSDLNKHPETKGNWSLMVLGMMAVKEDATAVRRWIEGFN